MDVYFFVLIRCILCSKKFAYRCNKHDVFLYVKFAYGMHFILIGCIFYVPDILDRLDSRVFHCFESERFDSYKLDKFLMCQGCSF